MIEWIEIEDPKSYQSFYTQIDKLFIFVERKTKESQFTVTCEDLGIKKYNTGTSKKEKAFEIARKYIASRLLILERKLKYEHR